MKKCLVRMLMFFAVATGVASAETVKLEFDLSSPQAHYAAQRLSIALGKRGYSLVEGDSEAESTIALVIDAGPLASEAFSVDPRNKSLTVTGGDGRGVIYGALSVAEQLGNGVALEDIQTSREASALPFRALKHNLPWDSYRSSSALDLHYDTVRDVKYWAAFLDMMAENRFNENAQQDYVGGYFVGSESYIPAKDYFTAVEAPVDWSYAFERQWLFYKLWGRLLYNPETPNGVFEAEFVRRYGETARPLLEAYALASSTQLRYATSIDFSWDFTIYGEGMMVLSQGGMQPMSVERLIIQPPLHPEWLSVKDFVAKRAAGEELPSGTVTPLILADRLEADTTKALHLVRGIDTSATPSLMYEVADVQTWANLGLYYAEKLRGAVALQTYRTAGDEADKRAAVDHLERSLAFWDKVIAITRPIYRDMPLAHHNPPDNQRNDDNLFHWALIRGPIAADIETAKNAQYGN